MNSFCLGAGSTPFRAQACQENHERPNRHRELRILPPREVEQSKPHSPEGAEYGLYATITALNSERCRAPTSKEGRNNHSTSGNRDAAQVGGGDYYGNSIPA